MPSLDEGLVEVVQFLVEHSADLTVQDNHGWSPLHSAAFKGHVEVAQFLVQHGADPSAQKKDGQSPLHLAALNGHMKIAQLLVEHGADLTVQDKDVWSGVDPFIFGVAKWTPRNCAVLC